MTLDLLALETLRLFCKSEDEEHMTGDSGNEFASHFLPVLRSGQLCVVKDGLLQPTVCGIYRVHYQEYTKGQK